MINGGDRYVTHQKGGEVTGQLPPTDPCLPLLKGMEKQLLSFLPFPNKNSLLFLFYLLKFSEKWSGVEWNESSLASMEVPSLKLQKEGSSVLFDSTVGFRFVFSGE